MIQHLSTMHQISIKLVTSEALKPFTITPYLSQDNLFCNLSHLRTLGIKFKILLHFKIDTVMSIAYVLFMGKPLRRIVLLL